MKVERCVCSRRCRARVSISPTPSRLGLCDDDQAQRAVDYLFDNDFAGSNLGVVGTNLASIARVTGRLMRGRVGSMFTTSDLGAIFSPAGNQLGFAAVVRGRTPDFSCLSQVVATR